MIKMWVAEDILQGKLIIIRQGTELHVERRYRFVDSAGDVLPGIESGRIVERIEWADIPTDVQDALLAIDAWTRIKILEKVVE